MKTQCILFSLVMAIALPVLPLEIGNSPGISQKNLAATLGKQQPAVSRALKPLSEADLIRSEKDGTTTRYRLSPEIYFALK